MPSQAIATQFANDPATFLRTSIVTWRGGGPQDQQVVTVAMLDNDATGRRRGMFGKTNANRYYLRHSFVGNANVPQGSPTFQAVWSGYVGGSAKTAALPAAGGPDIMLTPELTGCSVVCRANADGSADFSHYNLMAGGNTLVQADMEAVAEAHFGGGQSTFSKEQYRALGKHGQAVRVTVAGFRRNGTWEFWGQIREDKA